MQGSLPKVHEMEAQHGVSLVCLPPALGAPLVLAQRAAVAGDVLSDPARQRAERETQLDLLALLAG